PRRAGRRSIGSAMTRPSSSISPTLRPPSRSRAANQSTKQGSTSRGGCPRTRRSPIRSLRPVLPRSDVLRLLRSHGVQPYAERLELEPSDLLVDLGRNDVDTVLEVAVVERDVLRRQRLVREAHVHDG